MLYFKCSSVFFNAWSFKGQISHYCKGAKWCQTQRRMAYTGQTGAARGTQWFGCRLGGMQGRGEAKSLTHLAASWGTLTVPHWSWSQQEHHHQEGAFAMGVRLRDSEENKFPWIPMPSIRMDPPASLGMCDSLNNDSIPTAAEDGCCTQNSQSSFILLFMEV